MYLVNSLVLLLCLADQASPARSASDIAALKEGGVFDFVTHYTCQIMRPHNGEVLQQGSSNLVSTMRISLCGSRACS